MAKTAYRDGVALVEQGIMTQEQLEEGISKGLIAAERTGGGPKVMRVFVSEAQKACYEAKQAALEAAKEAVAKNRKVAEFIETYGDSWSDNGEDFKTNFAVYWQNGSKALASFKAE